MDPVVVRVPVRFRDCDPMGHVNHAVYLTYFEVARTEVIRRLFGKISFPFILADAQVSYRSPATFGEDLLVRVEVESVGTKSWRFRYLATEAESGREVAVGTTVQVAYDYAAGRSVPIPQEWRRALQD